MNKERIKQVEEASQDYAWSTDGCDTLQKAFEIGAKWADSNPINCHIDWVKVFKIVENHDIDAVDLCLIMDEVDRQLKETI